MDLNQITMKYRLPVVISLLTETQYDSYLSMLSRLPENIRTPFLRETIGISSHHDTCESLNNGSTVTNPIMRRFVNQFRSHFEEVVKTGDTIPTEIGYYSIPFVYLNHPEKSMKLKFTGDDGKHISLSFSDPELFDQLPSAQYQFDGLYEELLLSPFSKHEGIINQSKT